MAAASIARNVIGVLVVYLALLATFLATPTPSEAGVRLECGNAGVVAIFPSVGACAADLRFKGGCACAMPPMKWTDWWYMLGLVPVITSALGHVLFRGSLFTRLLLLNAAIGVGLFTENMRTAKNVVAPRVLPDEPGLLFGFCASFTALFIMIHFLRRAFARYKSANTDRS